MRAFAFALALLLGFAPAFAAAQDASSAPVLQRISGLRIASIAHERLAQVASPDEHYAGSAVPDQIVPRGRVQLLAQAPQGGSQFVEVPVQIDLNGKPDRTVMVAYRVQRYVQTAVAAHDLLAGTVLSAQDVVMGRVPFTGLDGNGTQALLGRTIVAPVLKGQPVPLSFTQITQIVKPGSTVDFVVHDNGVDVSADVVARTGGGLGQQVFVFDPQTGKELSGTVTAPGTVELDISGGDAP